MFASIPNLIKLISPHQHIQYQVLKFIVELNQF